MVNGLLHRQPQLGVRTHEARHEVFGVLADVTPEIVMELVFPPDDLSEQLGLRFVLLVFKEWRVTTEHNVGDDATRPEVLSSAGLRLPDDLR